MIKTIGAILRYSLLVLVILVLSHIIEIKGVSISKHVLNGMHVVSGFAPDKVARQISGDYTKALQERFQSLEGTEAALSKEDQRELDRLIEKAQRKSKSGPVDRD
jgi:hypothetical protein